MNFANEVYSLLGQVPRGKVTTYKILAEALKTKAYRAVGQALRTNPYAPEVPCHRVVRSDGHVGGFMGETSGDEVQKKIDILKSEGVIVQDGKVVDFQAKTYLFGTSDVS